MPDYNRGRFLFPPYWKASEDGLLAYGGDLEPSTLLQAYARGIFPWYNADCPILWWCPNPRCVLYPGNFSISSRSARKIRNSGFEYSFDQAFDKVIQACAAARSKEAGTWILPEMQIAYCRLHYLGYAHSVEIWKEGELVGGLYGIGLGAAFFGESMFHKVSEASRAALVYLVCLLRKYNYRFVDCQQESRHMLAMGAQNISRNEFIDELQVAISLSGLPIGSWTEAGRMDGFKFHDPDTCS